MPDPAAAAAAVRAAVRTRMRSRAVLPARAGHSLQPHFRRQALALLPGPVHLLKNCLCMPEMQSRCSCARGAATLCPLMLASACSRVSDSRALHFCQPQVLWPHASWTALQTLRIRLRSVLP